jgi:hypothetical protein
MGYNKGMARKGFLSAVLVWLVLGVASAQQWLDLRFQDSVSGRALAVEVVLTEQATGQTYAFQSQPDGRLQVLLPEGDYVLYATHAGYHAVGVTLAVRPDMPPYRFYLDPLTPPREADWRYLWSLRQPNQMIVVGFVTDEQTGQPLAGVQVRVRNHAGMAETDANGMFPAAVSHPRPAGQIPALCDAGIGKGGLPHTTAGAGRAVERGRLDLPPDDERRQRGRNTRHAVAAPS